MTVELSCAVCHQIAISQKVNSVVYEILAHIIHKTCIEKWYFHSLLITPYFVESYEKGRTIN